jgi:hypothetical protein
MSGIDYLVGAAIAAILVVVFFGSKENRDSFEAACAKSGGETVYDGRQWQCMNAKGKP